jgi:hypothetical protein
MAPEPARDLGIVMSNIMLVDTGVEAGKPRADVLLSSSSRAKSLM